MGHRLTVAFNKLRRLLNSPVASNSQTPFPKSRNVVLDIVAEGRRKNIVHCFFEVDANALRAQISKCTPQSGKRISITSYISGILAASVAADPRMHAYRHKGRELILFDDVDLSVMVERNVDGRRQPLPFIVRAANRKTFLEVDEALKQAKSAPLFADGPLSALEAQFFSLPRILRKIVWAFARNDAHLFRQIAGTVGVTSLVRYSTGRMFGLPITPMSLTLTIGEISPHLTLVDGVLIEGKSLQLTLSADHDVIDGVPLARFMHKLKVNLEQGMS